MKIALPVIGIILIAGVFFLLSSGEDGSQTANVPTNALPSTNTADAENSNGSPASETVDGDEDVDFAPDFTLERLDGGTIMLSSYRGVKPVVLDFWASWCPDCRRNMPNLNVLYGQYRDRIEVIGVNLQERESTVRTFVEDQGFDFPIVLDPQSKVKNAFGIPYTNYQVLITKEGAVLRVIPGDIKESYLQELLS